MTTKKSQENLILAKDKFSCKNRSSAIKLKLSVLCYCVMSRPIYIPKFESVSYKEDDRENSGNVNFNKGQ